ncbi:MAG: AtzE family amidohydrolase [Pseudomonadota bacterium]|nr:AtzE family amidohydrolase [Pseudomonadota bacterium]
MAPAVRIRSGAGVSPVIGDAADIVSQISQGVRSAVSVLAETKELIKARNPDLNCFTATTFERAEREAAAIDALRALGKPLPPLAGVPYAVKNLFDIEGMVTLAGAKVNASNAPAAADATVVARMHRAGAVLVGALNMEELAYGFVTENPHYGTTRNPHDRTRGAGGSSGGSAAAVGAGMVPISLGSDTSGSIRVPASLCGVFGLKPTYGRLPRSGTFPFVNSFDHVGPFGASVSDLALAYDAMQGPDPLDPACAQRAVEPVSMASTLPPGIRIGILGGWFHEWAGPVARRAVQFAAATLRATEWTELKGAEAARAAAYIITGAEGGALHRPRLLQQYEDFGPASRARLAAGSLIPASWVVQAQRVRQQVYREAMELFKRFDLLIAAASPVVAPRVGEETLLINDRSIATKAGLGVLTQPISCIGLPVCTVPVWPGSDASSQEPELPLGVQLIGAPWREDLCLRAARTLEQAGVAQFRLP